MIDMKIEKIEIDFYWIGEYSNGSTVTQQATRVRGASNAFVTLPVNEVANIQEVAKGFLLGALYQQGLDLQDVVFEPSDTMNGVYLKGEPVYVHRCGDNYELETWFHKKET
ncbi:hypothetical protein NVP1121O_197 [Vibrio phage 1.121.O._10N.286.46.C4]|nr:hypothetical protein NVP1121O_197 [Vibrio phage 1.121.O._10N.286.46.C4]